MSDAHKALARGLQRGARMAVEPSLSRTRRDSDFPEFWISDDPEEEFDSATPDAHEQARAAALRPPELPADLAPDFQSLRALLAGYDDQDIPCRASGFPEFWISDDFEHYYAAALACRHCPAVRQCAAYGVRHPDEAGVYGGHIHGKELPRDPEAADAAARVAAGTVKARTSRAFRQWALEHGLTDAEITRLRTIEQKALASLRAKRSRQGGNDSDATGPHTTAQPSSSASPAHLTSTPRTRGQSEGEHRMSSDLLVAAIKLDAGDRDSLLATSTVARDSAAASGNVALGEFLNELLIVLHDARLAVSAEKRTLDEDFARAIGIDALEPTGIDDEGPA